MTVLSYRRSCSSEHCAIVELVDDELSFVNGEVAGTLHLQVDYRATERGIDFTADDVVGSGASITLGGREFPLTGQSQEMADEWLKVPSNFELLRGRLEAIEEKRSGRQAA